MAYNKYNLVKTNWKIQNWNIEMWFFELVFFYWMSTFFQIQLWHLY